jgi:hypothetical protein
MQTSPYQVSRIVRDLPTFFIPTRQSSTFAGLQMATFASELCNVGIAASTIIQILELKL